MTVAKEITRLDGYPEKNAPFLGETKKGVLTGNNDVYLRLWHEVRIDRCGFGLSSHIEMLLSKKKWFPVTSGGYMRRWYGNIDTVVNLEDDGRDIKYHVTNYRLRDPKFYMRESIAWTEISSSIFSVRYVPQGILFGNGGPVSFFYNHTLFYHLGFLNTKVAMSILTYIAPTINYGPEQVNRLPVFIDTYFINEVDRYVKNNIVLSKNDWDAFETSWDFQRHTLLPSSEKPAPATAREQTPNIDEKQMEFAIFCVENLAEDLGQDATAVFDLLTKESDLLYSYVIPCYEPLHSQDKAYILDDIKGVMRERGLLP